MTRYGYKYATLCLIVLCLAGPLAAQNDLETPPEAARTPISPSILQQLPAAYRDEAGKLQVTVTDQEQGRAIKQAAVNPDASLTLTVYAIARAPQGIEFLLQELDQEASPARRILILKAGIQPAIRKIRAGAMRDRMGEVLVRLVAQDSASNVSLEAAQDLRRLQWGNYSEALVARADKAKQAGDNEGSVKLLSEGEQWMGWDTQINLPNFMRTPPALFSVVPDDKPIRALAFGDFGTASPEQLQLAAAMREYQKHSPLDFGLTLGDNFYPNGVGSTDDPQWKTKWEDLYSAMGIKFYASLGNHDYNRPDSPAAEIMYGLKSSTWRMPSTYYTFTAGPAQFFAIDTIELSDTSLPNKELEWLDAEIGKSKAKWKIVYGHYQIYSATRGDEQNLIQRLLPLLRNRVDLYLCGHDHNLQELKEENGVHFFVSGGGGAGLYDFRVPNYTHSTGFKDKKNGFTILEADGNQLTIRYFGIGGEELYHTTFHK